MFEVRRVVQPGPCERLPPASFSRETTSVRVASYCPVSFSVCAPGTLSLAPHPFHPAASSSSFNPSFILPPWSRGYSYETSVGRGGGCREGERRWSDINGTAASCLGVTILIARQKRSSVVVYEVLRDEKSRYEVLYHEGLCHEISTEEMLSFNMLWDCKRDILLMNTVLQHTALHDVVLWAIGYEMMLWDVILRGSVMKYSLWDSVQWPNSL